MEALVKVRQITKDDWRDVLRLYESLSEEDLYLRFFHIYKLSPEEAMKLAKEEDHYTVVAEVGGEVVGEATLHEDGEFSVVVASDYRKSHLGTWLVRELIKHAKETGMKEVKFYTLPENRAMISLGQKLGFTLTFDDEEIVGVLKLS
ncbi:N-acetyltransferase [Sulfodiicoccus acidiphilus]|uniref:N-acetyltransferase n=1 Tax=Sulfodiicoccus acidiphilus TaxID=1670455 RepID=A0A348B0Z3_9CREN|nr:GNAT family N-acetyltransferase [Sulfodiicoccus acidiphilus]BBD71845.1 N-acetyltransferase [Sulfodiicoccus acidiphilus]GGU02419.1 N-acetyltransferase [Sulfodiicoccus acidiphilus]